MRPSEVSRELSEQEWFSARSNHSSIAPSSSVSRSLYTAREYPSTVAPSSSVSQSYHTAREYPSTVAPSFSEPQSYHTARSRSEPHSDSRSCRHEKPAPSGRSEYHTAVSRPPPDYNDYDPNRTLPPSYSSVPPYPKHPPKPPKYPTSNPFPFSSPPLHPHQQSSSPFSGNNAFSHNIIQHHGTGDINISLTRTDRGRRSVYRKHLFSPTDGDVDVYTITHTKVNDDGTISRATETRIKPHLHNAGSERAQRVKQEREYAHGFGSEFGNEYDYGGYVGERDSGYGRSIAPSARTEVSIIRDEATPGKALKKLFTDPIGFCKDAEQVRRAIQAEEKGNMARRKMEKRGGGYGEEDWLFPGDSWSRAEAKRWG
ncbi:hypothetical protein K458DRAFT_397024 [Lentithecium fluviatile CBS 122367]|uniref:Uncharacterized protein n=1 Tax=Lentithecium fluviatile CBS 122367 TaxID=1168545 RepID=A0A6G1IE35_9PLEO|nr:hypothetical protein K458DRAFT_397024 [Lentithecium fluviatile CBS 122367]